MFKRLVVISLALGMVVALSVGRAGGDDPKWKEKQQAYFEQMGLKPGDVIEKQDLQKVDGLLPPQIVDWVKKEYLPNFRIAELKYDGSPDQEWVDAGLKNIGKYALNETKNVVVAATGEFPLYLYGDPFPNLDFKNDPDASAKFMWNRMVNQFRAGGLYAPFQLEWIGRKGFERVVDAVWIQYCYWGSAKGPQPNPNKYRYMYLTGVTKPYDLAGIAQLTFRKLDGSVDDFYVYVPAIRRIKKMSGANRSDPYVGSDLILDDGSGFAGLTSSMKWRFLEEKMGLLCYEEQDAEQLTKLKRAPGGGWRSQPGEGANIVGWQVEGWKWAKWAPVNAVWVPRPFIVIEAIPVDPYYNSGKNIYWVDKETYHTAYKMTWDKAGEHWKTINFLPRCIEWGDRKGYHAGGTAGYQIVDEKQHHATRVLVKYVDIDPPRVTPKMFTVERLRMMSK